MSSPDPRFGCGEYIPGDHDKPVDPPPPDPGEDEPGPGDPYDPPDYEDDPVDDFGDGDGGGGPPVPDPARPRPVPDDSGGGGGGGGAPGVPGQPVVRPGGVTAGPRTPPAGTPGQPAPAPGAGGSGGGGGGAGAPGAPEPICELYYCDNDTLRSVLLPISEILALSPDIPGSARTCDDIPDAFTGIDEVAYSKTRLNCGTQGAGGGAVGFDFDATNTAGGQVFGVNVDSTTFDPPTGVADGGLYAGEDVGPGFSDAGGLGGFDIDGPDPPGNLGGFQTGIDFGGTNDIGVTAINGDGFFNGGASDFDFGDGTGNDPNAPDASILPTDFGDGVVIDDGGSTGGGFDATSIGGDLQGAGIVDLNEYNNRIADDEDARLTDPDLALRGGKRFSRRLVPNDYGRTDIFRDIIAEGLLYILKNNNNFRDWSSNALYSLDTILLLLSLRPEVLKTCRQIRHVSGRVLSDDEISRIFLNRIMEGRLESIDLSYLQRLSEKTRNLPIKQYIKSTSKGVNQIAAVQLIDKNKYPLDDSLFDDDTEAKSTIQNYKTFATDLAKYLPITVGEETYKYYINDSDQFIDRTTLTISDGDYFLCRKGGVETRLPIISEKDHAFIIDESTRQRAIDLLDGNPNRTIQVSGSVSGGVEFDYSLSAPRKNAYVLKIIPSGIVDTTPKGYLKKTRAPYEYMDDSTLAGRRAINNYIRYKSNYLTINLDDEDLIFDYIENGSNLFLEQTDIIFESAKTNKQVPILVRQIPWYVVLVPTNRKDKLLFGTKSRVASISDEEIITRSLTLMPRVDPESQKERSKLQIKRVNAAKNNLNNVKGEYDSQAVVYEFDPDIDFYSTTYETSSGQRVSASNYTPQRRKTTFRLIKEILEEFKSNYVLDREGSVDGVNLFDLFSRLNMTEFNKFSILENGRDIIERIKVGMLSDIHVFPSLKYTGRQAARKTRLVQRRATATEDRFPSIKSLNNARGFVRPPTEVAESSTITIEPLEDLVAECTASRAEEL